MIELNWTLWLQFANFFILMAVLNIVLYRPLRSVIERRRTTIDGSHQKAKDLEAKIQEKMDRYQAQLQDAKLEAGQEKMAMLQEAARAEAQILGQARTRAAEQVQAIRDRITSEAKEAGVALRAETESLAATIASKVLGRNL